MPSRPLETTNLAMRIVLFTLRCVVGLFAAIGFMVVVGGVAVILWWRQIAPWEATRQTPDVTVLTLDLGAGVVETSSSNPLTQASRGDAVILSEALLALEAAAGDPRVKGLLTRVGRGEVGLAQVQELRDAIARFRKQGKFTIAFAETFGDVGSGMLHYYVASTSEKIWLQPSGELDLTGFHLESPFLRSALNDLGIQPQLGQRENYKGATTIFTDTSLPELQRENLQQLVRSWLSQVIRDVGADRGLPERELREIVNLGPFVADDAEKQGLVDFLGYSDQASKLALDLAGEGAEFLSLAEYSNNRDAPPDEAPTIAVIFGLGAIALGESGGDPVFERLIMDADTVSTAIDDAVDDEKVAAIVFRIDSPGGSYVASDVIWREVKRAREADKPLIVSMGNVAASGGYFVAAPAYRIVSQPGTVTGSIGVAGGKFVLSELWDRLGVHWDGVQAGAHADMWSIIPRSL